VEESLLELSAYDRVRTRIIGLSNRQSPITTAALDTPCK
jgi:hypothetical protein